MTSACQRDWPGHWQSVSPPLCVPVSETCQLLGLRPGSESGSRETASGACHGDSPPSGPGSEPGPHWHSGSGWQDSDSLRPDGPARSRQVRRGRRSVSHWRDDSLSGMTNCLAASESGTASDSTASTDGGRGTVTAWRLPRAGPQ